jgi:hypothetical protein
MGLIRTRFIVGINIFIIPALICLFVSLIYPTLLNSISFDDVKPIYPITKEMIFSQVTNVSGSGIKKVSAFFGTYMRKNTSEIDFDIIDINTNEVLFNKILNTNKMKDNSWYVIDVPNIQVNQDSLYEFKFSSHDATIDNSVTLYTTGVDKVNENCYGMINGERQNFNFRIKILGEK